MNAREDVVEGLDPGLFRAFGCGAAGTEKNGSFSARSSVLEETDFQAVSAFVEQKIRAGGTADFGWKNRIGPV